jgi:hypothetical protein
LEFLSAGACRAERRAKSRRGSGKATFDRFIEALLVAARQRRGDWTIGRGADGVTYTGTLLEAVELLKPYLPQKGFLPAGTLGRSIEYVREKFKDHTTKSSSSDC